MGTFFMYLSECPVCGEVLMDSTVCKDHRVSYDSSSMPVRGLGVGIPGESSPWEGLHGFVGGGNNNCAYSRPQ